MKCPNCDTENRDSAKFCDECGKPLPNAKPEASEEDAGESTCEAPTEAMPALDDSASAEEPEPADEESGETADAATDAEGAQELERPEGQTEDHGDDLDWIDREPEDLDIADKTVAFDNLSAYADAEDSYIAEGFSRPEPDWHDGMTMRMAPVADEQGDRKSKDFLASSTVRKSPHAKRIAIIGGAIAAVAIIAAVATYSLEMWGGRSVPDVAGFTEAEATALLEENGFEVRSMQVQSDDTEGLVLVMDPSAGSRADKGSEIVIHIATARLIPDVIGKTEKQAAEMLEESGFTNVTFEEEPSDRPVGTVVRVEPDVGTRTKSGDPVLVLKAKPYTVPDISDKYLDDAQKALEDAGFVPVVEYVYTDGYPEGLIIGTRPATGAEASPGATVSILISRSRESECLDLTQMYLAPGSTISSGLYSYVVDSVQSVTYLGNDTVAYSITARPFTEGADGIVYMDPQVISGTITWSAGNQILSMT